MGTRTGLPEAESVVASHPPEEGEFRFSLASPRDEEALVSCMQQAFPAPAGEVMACALGLGPDEYYPYSILVARKAVRDGLTLLARDRRGEVVGFLVGEDYATMPDYLRPPVLPRMFPLLDLLRILDAAFDGGRKPPAGEMFHFYMLGVRPGQGRRGLGRRLIERGLELARERGFERAVAEATGVVSQRLCRQAGFQRVAAVSYAEYRYEGRPVFGGIPEPESCLLVTRKLGAAE